MKLRSFSYKATLFLAVIFVFSAPVQAYDDVATTPLSDASTSQFGQTPIWLPEVTATGGDWKFYDSSEQGWNASNPWLEVDLSVVASGLDPSIKYDVWVDYFSMNDMRTAEVSVGHDGTSSIVKLSQFLAAGEPRTHVSSKILSNSSALGTLRVGRSTYWDGVAIAQQQVNIKNIHIVPAGRCDVDPLINCSFLDTVKELPDAVVSNGNASCVLGALYAFPSLDFVSNDFVLAHGQLVYASDYPDFVLKWTGSNTATSMTVKDMRAEFVRGADMGRGIDSGRVIGSDQSDEFKEHDHSGTYITTSALYAYVGPGESGNVGAFKSWNAPDRTTTSSKVTPDGGVETRPRNVAHVYAYCAK